MISQFTFRALGRKFLGQSTTQQDSEVKLAPGHDIMVRIGPNKPWDKVYALYALCRPAMRSTRRSTLTPWSTLWSFPRSAWRDGRPCLPRKSWSLKIRQKVIKLAMTRWWKIMVLPKMVMREKNFLNAPKRPPSFFFLFCSEYCPKIKSEHRPVHWRYWWKRKVGDEIWSEQSAKVNNYMNNKQLS